MVPYISKKERANYLGPSRPETVGQLTYVLTKVIVRYVRTKGLMFQTVAEVLGALDATTQEFYRRVVGPYEVGKIKANGDVYDNIDIPIVGGKSPSDSF